MKAMALTVVLLASCTSIGRTSLAITWPLLEEMVLEEVRDPEILDLFDTVGAAILNGDLVEADIWESFKTMARGYAAAQGWSPGRLAALGALLAEIEARLDERAAG